MSELLLELTIELKISRDKVEQWRPCGDGWLCLSEVHL